MLGGDQKGRLRIDPDRTIMKLSGVSRLSQDYTSGHWLAWRSPRPGGLPRTREENLFLAQGDL